jgi:hypothetical protein
MMGLLYSEGNIPLPEGNIPRIGALLGFCRDARSLRVFFNSGALYGSNRMESGFLALIDEPLVAKLNWGVFIVANFTQ